MVTNANTKAFAWAGITLLTAALFTGGTVVVEALLYKIKEADAATQTAKAETGKADAEMQKAIAERAAAAALRLDAENKLLAAVEARNGQTMAAQYMALGQEHSADITGKSLIGATEIDRHVDNAMFDGVAGPIIVEPSRKIAALNVRIVRLKREAESGADRATRRSLSEDERADRLAEAKILEDELQGEQETSAKSMGDTMRLILNGASQAFGGLMAGGNPISPSRRAAVAEQ